jgi:hypothetical protein
VSILNSSGLQTNIFANEGEGRTARMIASCYEKESTGCLQ